MSVEIDNSQRNVDGLLQLVNETQENAIVNLNDILDQIETLNVKNSFNITSNDKKTVITGTLPKWFYFDNLGSLISSCVNTINFNDRLIDLTKFNIRDRVNIVDQLPAPVFTEIINDRIENKNFKIKNKLYFICSKKKFFL